MKNKKLLTLPLIALALVGCNRTTTSSTPASVTPNPSVEPTTTETNDSTSSTSTTTVVPDSGDELSTSKDDDQASADSSTSSAEEEKVTSPWAKDITELFVKHLGGHILPYIDLGSGSIGEWIVGYSDYGVLTIEAATAQWDSTTTYNDLSTAFASASYTVDAASTQTKFIATSPDGLVHVTVAKKASTDKTIVVTATYDEPYDTSKALTDWDKEDKELIEDTLGATLPYLYTGVQYPNVDTDYYGESIVITGGKWDASVVTDLKTTLTSQSATFTNESSTGFTATFKIANQDDSFKVVLSQYGSTYAKVRLEVSVVETFNPQAADHWESDVTDFFTSYLDGHSVPFVYLGTKSPTPSYSTYYDELEIKGSIWDDQIITLADTAFKADTSDNTTWTIEKTTTTFTATKTIPSDLCQLTVNIYKYTGYYSSSSSYPIMEITYKEGMVVPDGSTWEATTQAEIAKANLPSTFTLPYVYLNLKNGASEDATWDEDTNTLLIYGGYYIEAIYDQAKATYEAMKESDGTTPYWTIVSDTYSPYLTMTHIDTTGDKYVVELGRKYDSSSGSDKYIAYLQLTYTAKYVVPEEATNYCQTVQTEITNRFHGHSLPYVYLRTLNESYYWYSNYNELDIRGGTFDAEMLTEANKNFTAAGWTGTINSTDETYTASKKFDEDGCTITAKLYNSSSYGATIEFTLVESYNVVNKQTGWQNTTESKLSTNFPGITLPYIYLGTRTETSDYSSYSNCLTITGGGWSNEILTDAKDQLTTLGWTYDEAKYNSSTSALLTKEDTENNMFYSIFLMNYSSKPTLKLFKQSTSGLATSSTQAYDSTSASQIKKYNGNYDIPFIDLGCDTYSPYYYSGSKQLELTGTATISNYMMYKAYKMMKEDTAYSVNLVLYSSDFGFTAETKNADDSKTTIKVANSYSKAYIDVIYSAPFKAPEGVDNWSGTIQTLMKQYFDGNVLPYFYMGANEPSTSYYSSYNELDLHGETWDDQVYDNCIEALKKDVDEDGNCNWTWMYQYTSGKKLTASKKIGDYYMSIILYKYTSGNPYPVLEIYYNTNI